MSEEELKKEYGAKWIWTAIDTTTRLVVHFAIGNRTLEQAKEFIKTVKARQKDQTKPLYVSDELPHYLEALQDAYSTIEVPPRTGKPGRPQNAKRITDSDLDYATVHKTRKNGKVVKVDVNILLGEGVRIFDRLCKTPSCTINTAFVERSNLSWRMMDSHLIRKSLCFAKSMEWLRAKYSIIVAIYNLVRPHSSLGNSKKPITPAMKAEITMRPWSIKQLLEYRTA